MDVHHTKNGIFIGIDPYPNHLFFQRVSKTRLRRSGRLTNSEKANQLNWIPSHSKRLTHTCDIHNGHNVINVEWTQRIHGAGIYTNIKGVYWWDPCYHI